MSEQADNIISGMLSSCGELCNREPWLTANILDGELLIGDSINIDLTFNFMGYNADLYNDCSQNYYLLYSLTKAELSFQ